MDLITKLLLWFSLVGSAISSISNDRAASTPTRFGFVLYPGFDVLDVFGSLEPLNLLSLQTYMNLSLIAATLEPVSSKPQSAINLYNSTFGGSVVPTHTFVSAPPLDVLFVPGGVEINAPDVPDAVDFIRKTYPSLQYLISICTGAGIVAQAGVLDGKNATTNKESWKEITPLGPKTYWVAHARWVQDGNVWTTSGVSAGIDGTIGWLEAVYGNDTANSIATEMEYTPHAQSYDPFAAFYNLTDVPPIE